MGIQTLLHDAEKCYKQPCRSPMQTHPLWDGKERAELTNGGVFTPHTHQAPEEPEAEMKGQSYSFNQP